MYFKFDVLIKDSDFGNMSFTLCADHERQAVKTLDHIQTLLNALNVEARIIPWQNKTTMMSEAELDELCERVERGPMCARCQAEAVPVEGNICGECFAEICEEQGRAVFAVIDLEKIRINTGDKDK